MKRIFDPALLDFYLQKHEIPSLFDTPDLAFSLYQFEKGERLDTLNPEEYLSFLVDGSIEISANRALNVPGEKELSGMGVSYCATCDGAFFKDKTVAVIGGGDVAVEDAIFLARTCKKVYVIHRRDELRAAGVLQDALLALPNVEMVWDTVVDSIEGNEMVSGVKVTNKKAGEAGEIAVDGVFIAVGIVPVSALIAGTVETDEAGYIKAGEDGVTSVPCVFAAGDVRTKQLRQIITAAADGANCVTSVEKYLISH